MNTEMDVIDAAKLRVITDGSNHLVRDNALYWPLRACTEVCV